VLKKYFNLVIIILTILLITASVEAGDYLSASETALIGAGSISVLYLGIRTLDIDTSKSPLIKGPILFEASLQQFLGGDSRAGKTNFLDSHIGSAATPVGISILMFAADLSWPQDDRLKTTLQDQFLYTTGLLATKGVTSFFKGFVARKRPLPYLNAEEAAKRDEIDHRYDRQSFFSGHTSSSFFAATFVNKRLRSIMRSYLTAGEYNDWKWGPPTLLFGWSTYVGWTRIHAYKHFVSDVLVGALAGYLIGELFYSFGDDFYNKIDQQNNPNDIATPKTSGMLFQINLKF
jgi:membrane-associated phospholipid phosphatase